MKKDGMGHVEVVLAFVLFISAVLFILSFFDVTNDTSAGEAALSSVNSILSREAQIKVISYSIVLNKSALDLQGNLRAIAIILPEEISPEQKIRIEAVSAGIPQKLQARKHATDKNQILVDRGSSTSLLLRVVVSEGISAGEGSVADRPHDATYYTVSSRSEVVMLAETKLKSLADAYAADYSKFRKNLGISELTHFGFSIGWSNPEIQDEGTQQAKQDFIKAERAIPSRVDVTAQNARQELLLQDGQRVFADLIVKTW